MPKRGKFFQEWIRADPVAHAGYGPVSCNFQRNSVWRISCDQQTGAPADENQFGEKARRDNQGDRSKEDVNN